MNDNGNATHPEEAPQAPVALAAPAALAPAPAAPVAAPAAPVAAPAAPVAAPAAPAAAPAAPVRPDCPDLQKAKAKAARRAKAKASRKAKATADALVQARKAKAGKTSPKVWASTLGGAAAFTFWTIATATFWKGTFSADTLAALIGSTTTIVAAAAAYLKADQLRSGE